MASPFTLFEISWEVCNKVGGIHTVLSTKAKTLVSRLGDDYIAVGPWLLSNANVPLDEESGFESFVEACRAFGIPVRVGRWRIPGRPRTILVEFSKLYGEKDAILSGLWESYGVDSISGEWDYAEPVLFSHAAGRVIEAWREVFLDPERKRGVVQAHEWMSGAALLYLKKHCPSIGTIFTTHATMLGRALSSLGHSPNDGLAEQTAEELAKTHRVVAKHSMEGVSAREADVLTTVSEITSKEVELLHRRAPDFLLYNGIDLEVLDELAGDQSSARVRGVVVNMASKFLGEDVSDALLLGISGRYEFHNKGIDLLLDSLGQMQGQKGKRVVLFVLVPAGNSGLRREVLERLDQPLKDCVGPIGISTHNLFDEEHDAVQQHCKRLGLDNRAGSRVKVIQIPIYLTEQDGFLNLPYEAVVRALDLTCFPSYYEPWGYTPQESLGLGVPTITTDFAGFGRWAQSYKLGPEHGVTVLARVRVNYPTVVENLAELLEAHLRENAAGADLRAACRATAARVAWSGLVANYEKAYEAALEAISKRLRKGVPQARRPKLALALKPAAEAQRPRLLSFEVSATLPDELSALSELARNYWWCWDVEATELFEELSPRSWETSGRNPVAFLKLVYREDIERAAADRKYVARLAATVSRMRRYLAEAPSGGDLTASVKHPIAYFSAEYGLHVSLPIYSGGLGVLAGDHLKSASDLNLPLIAIGLFYRMGYMAQRLTPTGEQTAIDVQNEVANIAMECVRGASGEPLEISLPLPGRELYLRAWTVAVGRVVLYLLDSNTPSNRPEDCDITRNLYGGESERRLQQEIVLGRGGVRFLQRLGIEPSVYHINEGHAAFLTLERVGSLVRQHGLTFDEARRFVRETTMFTTHTPVPAGHDRFGEDLMRRYFSDVHEWLGVPWERFYALGQSDEQRDAFNMTYLALNLSAFANGVSKLHGVASRDLLRPFWPRLLASEVPIETITNGIHLASWTHAGICRLLGVEQGAVRGSDFSSRARAMDRGALWGFKMQAKRRLIEQVARRLRKNFLQRHDSPRLLARTLDGLDLDALWIGFARRFAPYKRAHLAFLEPQRLRALCDRSEHPLRLIVAGKAHPRDEHGKQILRNIVEITRSDDFVGRVFFLEDYDMEIARALVQGVDVWLNTPIRMLEASGTSGMKASANGGLNLSIGDGWWSEAYDGKNGWRIGDERVYDNQELQDQLDAGTLYNLIEEELLPLFTQRDKDGLPQGWLDRIVENLATIPPSFNTDRMVEEYRELGYDKLGRQFHELTAERNAKVKTRARELARIRRGFTDIKIVGARIADLSSVRVGDPIDVHVEVELGALAPEDVVVEFVLGHTNGSTDLHNATCVALEELGKNGAAHMFQGTYVAERSGSYAYGIRVRGRDPSDPSDVLRDLVLWA